MVIAAVPVAAAGDPLLPLPGDLTRFRGQARVLLVNTPSVAHDALYRDQAALWLPDWAGWVERDVFILTREGSGVFSVRLVGKDGGVKFTSTRPVTTRELFAIIDAMPMRQAEAGRKSGSTTR